MPVSAGVGVDPTSHTTIAATPAINPRVSGHDAQDRSRKVRGCGAAWVRQDAGSRPVGLTSNCATYPPRGSVMRIGAPAPSPL